MITARFSVLGVLIHWEFNIDTVIPSVARAVWFFGKASMCISSLDSHCQPTVQKSILLTRKKREAREMMWFFLGHIATSVMKPESELSVFKHLPCSFL